MAILVTLLVAIYLLGMLLPLRWVAVQVSGIRYRSTVIGGRYEWLTRNVAVDCRKRRKLLREWTSQKPRRFDGKCDVVGVLVSSTWQT